MKRVWQILTIGGLLLALTSASGLAQGRGWCGQGRGWCGQGAGCWLTRVTPTDPQQKAFVEQVGKLQTEIIEEQAVLRALQTGGADIAAVGAQQAVVEKLRTQFRELMTKNGELVKQIAQQYGGPGWCGGRGAGCCAACPTGANGPACGSCPGCPWAR